MDVQNLQQIERLGRDGRASSALERCSAIGADHEASARKRKELGMATSKALIPVERIERTILRLRGHAVMLASDLAQIYGVETRALNQAVKRNPGRFPRDFAFRLTRHEAMRIQRSRSQSVILIRGKNIKYTPLAFTEYGAIMAASVLNSPRAVQMSIFVVRAFVRLRQMLQSNSELARKLDALETKYDAQFRVVFQAIRELMTPPATLRKRIGFRP